MRVGLVILPLRRWPEQAHQWRRADELGFDSLWTYDHLTWDPLEGMPWGATVPTLVAAAQVTSRARLGTWVASPNYRHPVPFARELAALDDVSGGRGPLGVVAGLAARFTDTLAEAGREPASIDRMLSLDAAQTFALSSVAYFTDAVGRAA